MYKHILETFCMYKVLWLYITLSLMRALCTALLKETLITLISWLHKNQYRKNDEKIMA